MPLSGSYVQAARPSLAFEEQVLGIAWFAPCYKNGVQCSCREIPIETTEIGHLSLVQVYTCLMRHLESASSDVTQVTYKVGSETVAKTFRPSYVISCKKTLLVFCQGRLRNAGDNEVKVILMNTSRDYGRTWEGVRVLSSSMNH